MKPKVIANVFYLENEDDIATQEAGIEIKLSDCVLKSYTFYNVDFVTNYSDPRFCVVSCGGVDFIVNERRESFESRYDINMNYPFN